MRIQLVETVSGFNELLRDIKTARIIGIDTEFTNFDVYAARLLLLSLYFNDVSYVIDLTVLDMNLLKQLKPYLETEDIIKVGHNLTVEWKFLYHNARIMMNGMHDTMVTDQLINAGLKMKFSLKDVASRRLNIDMDKQIRTEFINWPEGATFTPEQIEYSGMDAVIPVQIYVQQLQDIHEQELDRVYDLEMHILAPTALMEYTGVPVKPDTLREMIHPFERFIKSANKAFQDIIIDSGGAVSITFDRDGYEALNASSGDQVKGALQRIGIEIKDSKGNLSLDSKVVQRWDMQHSKKHYKDFDIDYHTLIDDDDVADALDLYLVLNNKIVRAYAFLQAAMKLLSTFILGMLGAINPITKRIHPTFKSLGAHRTGRYSSSRPNFQNLPNDIKLQLLGLGKYSIRKAIQATKGRKLIISDFSGIELLILAVLSGDMALLNEIIRGDIHNFVAINVLDYKGITSENKKKEPHKYWRAAAKTLSYAIAYGTTGRNVSETLNIMLGSQGFKITAKQGDELIARWYALFPSTAAYLESNGEQAVIKGYVCDVWGRRRHWDTEVFKRNTRDAKWLRLAAMREGKNAPIQGTSATMTKVATRLLYESIDLRKARMIITVHDELVFEVVDSYVEEAKQLIKDKMEDSIRMTLPLIAEYVGLYDGTSVDPKESELYDK
jgi:DNA polymerase-1